MPWNYRSYMVHTQQAALRLPVQGISAMHASTRHAPCCSSKAHTLAREQASLCSLSLKPYKDIWKPSGPSYETCALSRAWSA